MRSSYVLFWLGALGCLTGCNLIKGLLAERESDPVEVQAEPTPEPVPEPAAPAEPTTVQVEQPEPEPAKPANEEQIQRFDDEKQLDNQAGRIFAESADVLRQPPSGDRVVVLRQGNELTKVAERQDFTLVTFQNPDQDKELLMGWVPSSALVEPTSPAESAAAPTQPAPPPKPAPPVKPSPLPTTQPKPLPTPTPPPPPPPNPGGPDPAPKKKKKQRGDTGE